LLEVYYFLTRREKIVTLSKLREIVSDEDLEFLEKNLGEMKVEWKFSDLSYGLKLIDLSSRILQG